MKNYYVYVLCSSKNGTLYIGVTGNLDRRVKNHKAGLVRGFTQKYSVYHLVYFETFESITVAIHREKQLKNWKRIWKINLIEKINPTWRDLFDSQE